MDYFETKSAGIERAAGRVALVASCVCAFVCAFLAASSAGCRQRRADVETSVDVERQSEELAPEETIADLTVESLFQEVVEAYANAKFYSDDGYVEIEYENDRERVAKSYRESCALTFAKPNLVKMELHDALLRSDGVVLRAEILNEDYDNQAIERSAPLVLGAVKELYPDPQFMRAAELSAPSNIFWTSPQLILLFAKDPIKTLVPPGAQTRALEPAYLRYFDASGEKKRILCDRAQVVDDDGARIYWIDRETKALARCELPVERLRAAEKGARAVSVKMEFPDQILSNEPVVDRESFKLTPLESVADVRSVERFLPPEIDALERVWPKGALVVDDPNDDRDARVPFELDPAKKTLIYFWKLDDEWRSAAFQALDEAARDPSFNVVAVNIDGFDVDDAELRAIANASGLTAPLAKLDRAALMREAPDFPTVVSESFLLLDENRAVLRYMRGRTSAFRARRALERLQSGADPAADDRNAFYAGARRFLEFMADADSGDLYRVAQNDAYTRPTPEKLNPRNFGLREMWRRDDLHAPCNPIAIVDRRDAPRADDAPDDSAPSERDVAPLARPEELPKDMLIVPCDGNAIALLSSDGKLLRKTTPAAAVGEPIAFVRTAEYGDGKRFYVASSPASSRKAHRFDENFVDLGSVDVGKMANQFVCDARLADVDRDGVPDLLLGLSDDPNLASSTNGGVYAVDMSSLRVLWKDETTVAPYCLDFGKVERSDGDPREYLLALNPCDESRFSIVAFNWPSGERESFPRVSESDFARYFAIAKDPAPDEASVVALVATGTALEFNLVGYDASGAEIWRQPIPDFTSDGVLEPLTTCDLEGDGQNEWIVASSNGVVSVFGGDGAALDSFQYGEEITGVCAARWGDATYLAIASFDRLSVWKVESRRRRR